MRPKLFTLRNFALALTAAVILIGLAFWIKSGMPLPGGGVRSTAGKLVFTSDRGGSSDLWMMSSDGSDAVNLTNDAPIDSQPAWDATGSTIAFVSQNRATKDAENPQLFEMKAAPGASVAQVTQTTSAKSAPVFGSDGRIYFLGSGQIFAITPDATDGDTILPNADQRKQYAPIFEAGGLTSAAPDPTGGKLLAVLHTEREDALVLYDAADDQQALSLVGVADKVAFSYLPTGGAIVLFNGAPPFNTARPLFSKPLESGQITLTGEEQAAIQNNIDLIASPDTLPENARPPENPNEHYMASVGLDGTVKPISAVPFEVDGIRVSPDGSSVAVTAETGKGAGVSIVPLDGAGGVHQIFNQPATHCRWSPDGKQVAFVSGNDIYVGPADGSTPPQNLTGGKGRNADPEWSPAKPAK